MHTKPEALRLAEQLEDPVNAKLYLAPYIAAELRRHAELWIVIVYHDREPCEVFGPFLLETRAIQWAENQKADAWEVKLVRRSV